MAAGTDALPARIVHDAFEGQPGNILNFGLFGQSLRAIDFWYQSQGIFGQVGPCRSRTNAQAYLSYIYNAYSDHL